MVSTDYGYLIGHRGRDGDPLDVLVCVSADLSEQFQLEVAHFFSVYKQLEHKPVEIGGWRSRADAIKVIEDAARLHEEHEASRA
jgi:inorganic pyrophosphatase